MLEFRILGPLEVLHDGRARGPRRAAPADAAGRAADPGERTGRRRRPGRRRCGATTRRRPPARRCTSTVSRLRRALGPAADRLETVAGGYRLVVEPGELDAERFERERDAALWRGPALADLRYEAALQPEIRRLEELRAAAIEDRVQADLDRGEHSRLAGELAALVAEHPLRERLRGQQMLALYRAGRHADALAALPGRPRRARRAGPRARAGAARARAGDPHARRSAGRPAARDRPAGAADAHVRPRRRRDRSPRPARRGPPRHPHRTGRRREDSTGDRGGPRGGGRFASLAAAAAADRVPALICDALAVARAPARPTPRRSTASSRGSPLLLVVDNLEHLPERRAAARRSARTPPDAAPAGHEPRSRWASVPSGCTRSLRCPRRRAVELFAARARGRDPAFALSDENAAGVAAVCERLGGLPLALELAAARLGVLSPAALAERLDDALDLLGHGPRDAPERQQTLRATLDWSFDLLDAASATRSLRSARSPAAASSTRPRR